MKKLNRILSLALAFIMLCSAFAGCGGDKKSGENKENNPGTSQGDTQKPQEEVRTYESPAIEAIVVTAEAYLDRRTYLQYDDSRLIDKSVGTVYRTDRFYYSPEDCTRQFTAYSNCAAWTYEVYYRALGIDIKHWYTEALQSATDMHAYSYNPSNRETDEEKKVVIDKFFEILKPGDMVNYRTNDATGHVMLYVGYDELIHCTGLSYRHDKNAENYENSGGIQRASVDELFSETGRNLFSMASFSIVRPLMHPDYKDAQPTEETLNRIKNLQDIIVEKCSSHPAGFTAAPGEEITYTFYIRSGRTTDTTLELIDNVPSNTTYVSGAEKQDGSKLSWNVSVPAGKTVEVKYTVKVNADANTEAVIFGEGTIGGVGIKCRPTYVGKNLDASIRSKIAASAAKAPTMGANDLKLAEKIYADAGFSVTLPDMAKLLDGLIPSKGAYYDLSTDNEYYRMLVPTMYGGYKCMTKTALYNGWRTKGVLASQLMEGDILVAHGRSVYVAYMYIGGNKAVRLDGTSHEVMDIMVTRDAFMSAIGYDRFAVIRPAMAK